MTPKEFHTLSRRDCDFLRIVASILVVVVHCVHAWVEQFYAGRNFLSLGFAATLIDQCVRFTVPVFFFLSGFGMTSQLIKSPMRPLDFYRSRLPKIVLPFLLWSVFTSLRHLDYFHDLPWESSPGLAMWRVSKFFFFDGFDYQFYFLIILFQFYLVLPFVYKWGRKRWVLGIFFMAQLIFMTPSDVILRMFGWQLPAVSSSLIILYGFYCCAGVYAAWHRDFLGGLVRRLSAWQAFVIWLAALSLLVIEFRINMQNGKSLWDTDHFNRWSVILYCLASLVLFMKIKGWILVHVHGNPHWAFLYTGVAPYTFFVYLVHTNILRLVDFLAWETGIWNFITRILWVVGGSYAVAWLAQWLLEDYPRARLAFGLPKEPLRATDLPGHSFLISLRGSHRDQNPLTATPLNTPVTPRE